MGRRRRPLRRKKIGAVSLELGEGRRRTRSVRINCERQIFFGAISRLPNAVLAFWFSFSEFEIQPVSNFESTVQSDDA